LFRRGRPPSPRPFSVQELLYDPGGTSFSTRKASTRTCAWPPWFPAGRPRVWSAWPKRPGLRLLHYEVSAEGLALEGPLVQPGESFQRDLLLGILNGARPDKGLKLLYETGFVQAYWPELARMSVIPHVKDYHPEGDGWEHTLETFKHRKQTGAVLSLALLLHDTGKPDAPATRSGRTTGMPSWGRKSPPPSCAAWASRSP